MASQKNMFSDSWHRIADKTAMLRPSIEVHKQRYRGENWYVLQDPYNNEFYRVTEAAYLFIGRLNPNQTIDEVWRNTIEKYPDEAPGQEEVIEIFSHLNNANMIQSDFSADAEQLFNRYKKVVHKQVRGQMMNFLFIKLPLFNPDGFLSAIKPLMKLIFNRFMFVVWCLMIGWALKIAVENFERVSDQSSGMLSPSNISWVLVVTIIIKAIHEFGHGSMCKHFGGVVPKVGIMLMVFAPLPFVDATSSWKFRSKWQRIAVNCAGMLFELFLAAVATIIWSHTDEGLVNSLAYNVMFLASVTTLLFNLNPLLKFDGYYIMSDLFELPNLQQRANKQNTFLAEYYLFGVKESVSSARSLREGWWLSLYGFGAIAYRIFLMASISFLVADQFFEAGLALALFTLTMYIVVPILKFVKYLFTSKKLQQQRQRAFAVTGIGLATVGVLLGVIPFTDHFTEPGILWSEGRTKVFAQSKGEIASIEAPSGTQVQKGDLLLRLDNPELQQEINIAEQLLRQAQNQYVNAQQRDRASIGYLEAQMQLQKKKLDRLKQDQGKLEVRAPQSGYWSAPDITDAIGKRTRQGEKLGQIVSKEDFLFFTAVSQKEASDLFNESLDTNAIEIKIKGEAAKTIPVSLLKITPSEKDRLPSPTLGWMGGGSIQVDKSDEKGTKVTEPYFEVWLKPRNHAGAQFYHERRGKVRFSAGESPLLVQWYRDLRRLIQRRIGL